MNIGNFYKFTESISQNDFGLFNYMLKNNYIHTVEKESGLIKASELGRVDMVDVLINQYNVCMYFNKSNAFYMALSEGHVNVVKLFFDSGFKLRKNQEISSIMTRAFMRDNFELVDFLTNKFHKEDYFPCRYLINKAIQNDKYNALRAFLNYDFNESNIMSLHSFSKLISKEKVDILKLLAKNKNFIKFAKDREPSLLKCMEKLILQENVVKF